MLRLKQLREQLNLKQTEIAKELGFSRQAYGNYENGRRTPDANTLKHIAAYFNVSVDYLLGGQDVIPENKKIPKDLRKILEEEAVTLNGRLLSDADKEKMFRIVEAAFYEAKAMNKRK